MSIGCNLWPIGDFHLVRWRLPLGIRLTAFVSRIGAALQVQYSLARVRQTMNQVQPIKKSLSRRRATTLVAICAVTVAASGCAAFGYTDEVLWRVASPDGRLVAVCQEVPDFDGPNYDVRLERPDGTPVRRLYGIGDGDPCSEVVWSADGRTLAVMSGHVARIRFVDVEWAMSHPEVRTSSWSWRQVDLSTERSHFEGTGLRFVRPAAVELNLCGARPRRSNAACESELRRFEIPQPIVTGNK